MSRSDIQRNGKFSRPMFNHLGPRDGNRSHEQATAEMVESIRNLQESYFVDFILSFERIAQTLDRIERRLATKLPLKRGRA